MKRFRKNQKGFTPLKMASSTGFTLVEIMAVVAIISMVTAMSVPNLLRTKINSNEAAAQASLKSLYTLTEDYRFANGSYPDDKSLFTDFVNTYYGKQSVISTYDLYSGDTYGYWTFQGYRYDYRESSSGKFEWIAMPDAVSVTGKRYFTITEAGTLQEVNTTYAATNYPLTGPAEDGTATSGHTTVPSGQCQGCGGSPNLQGF